MSTLKLLYALIVVSAAYAEYKYETKWLKVPLDHFSFARNETFQIKYLVNNDSWDSHSGPIFFYTGNEGQIELFAQHTGFMWDIAAEFKAKLVFAEHRYYGASMPFGGKSLEKEYLGYLTSSQALADYADLVKHLQGDHSRPRYPVIAFGGSYGGMLSAYFRMKYPHLVDGAIAASAPIHQFSGMVPCDAYSRIVTSSFHRAGRNCSERIKQSWAAIRNITKNATETTWLEKSWRLCDPIKNASDVNELIDFVRSVYETMAMVNYPYSSDFLVPLPENPVRYVCQFLTGPSFNDEELVEAIGKIVKVYTNYTGKNNCTDYKAGSDYGNLNATGWDYQACTEMVMPMCTTGENDMFEPSPWNVTEFTENCYSKYGVNPQFDKASIEYGGSRLKASSNIVFSNGLLDPWTAGGILYSPNDLVKVVIMIDSAHHLDLMASNPADPSAVKAARDIHKAAIRHWIAELREDSKP